MHVPNVEKHNFLNIFDIKLYIYKGQHTKIKNNILTFCSKVNTMFRADILPPSVVSIFSVLIFYFHTNKLTINIFF